MTTEEEYKLRVLKHRTDELCASLRCRVSQFARVQEVEVAEAWRLVAEYAQEQVRKP